MRARTLGLIVLAVGLLAGCGKPAVTTEENGDPDKDRGRSGTDTDKDGGKDRPGVPDLAKVVEGLTKNTGAGVDKARREHHTANLRTLGEAMHTYETVFGTFPPHAVYAADNVTPLLSWRVLLLPYLGEEEEKLFTQFKLDEPWDGPTNKPLLAKMPAVYAPPKGQEAAANETCYQVFAVPAVTRGFVGISPVFRGKEPTRIAAVTDGTHNTFLIVEVARTVPWTKPDDLAYDGDQPLPALGAPGSDVFHVCFADGSVRAVSKKYPAGTVRAFITCNGGEIEGIQDELDNPLPAAGKTGSLTGRVLFQGQPLGGVWVRLTAEDGREAWGTTNEDGTYGIADAPAGAVKVTVGEWRTFTSPMGRPRLRLDRRYRQTATAGITGTIAEGKANVFNIELK